MPLTRLGMKAKWLHQQDVLFLRLSVSRAAAALDVVPATAFRGRHRFLHVVQTFKAAGLTGVAGADETFFLRSSPSQCPGRKARKRDGCTSRKDRGMDLIPILIARDRSGATTDFLRDAVSEACLSEALKPSIHSDASSAPMARLRWPRQPANWACTTSP